MDLNSLFHSLGITTAEFWTEAVGFIILVWLLNKFLLGPISGVLTQRQDEIKQTYDQLDADREAMHKTRDEYEKRLADIENQARERIQAAVKEAQELRASIIDEAQKKAQATIEAGLAELERERTRAMIEMRGEVANLAIDAASKVIGASVDNDRQRALVNDFIASVGAVPLTSVSSAKNGNGVGAN
jgi:F-type H+-transporting ATPase subunit b